MGWLQSRNMNHASREDRIATEEEVLAAFDTDREFLYWIALVITGEPRSAGKSLVDASGLSRGSRIFQDWLVVWSRSATARTATVHMRKQIAESAIPYAGAACDHSQHPFLTEEQVEFIHQIGPRRLTSELDAISRAMLILRGVQRASLEDCAILLQVTQKCALGAYCNALLRITAVMRRERHIDDRTIASVMDLF